MRTNDNGWVREREREGESERDSERGGGTGSLLFELKSSICFFESLPF